jgi:hypothetical protein
MSRSRWISCLLVAGLAASLLPAGAAQAQSGGDGYLFRQPVVGLTLRGGFHHASAGSNLFDLATEQLTLNRGDFGGPMVGADLAIRLQPRLDLVLGAAYSGTTRGSEFREFVEGDGAIGIEQTTSFERVPLTAGVRAYLTPRGRTVGTLAWVPARVAPYVGAGGGAMWYRFRQEGDFVDFDTPDLEIFTDVLDTQGWAPTAHGLAGVDFSLSPRLALTGEARYTWGRAEARDAFAGFDPVDLSGVAGSIGITIRF